MNDIFGSGLDSIEHELVFNRPSANYFEKEDSFEIHLAAPGLSKGDFNIEVKENVLEISVDKAEDEKGDRTWIRKGFNYNHFTRRFRIRPEMDPESIKAVYDNGILAITIAKLVNSSSKYKVNVD